MRQALELALKALERSVATCFDQRSHDAVMGRPEHFVNQAITAIKEALAQPEQEPCDGCRGSGWIPRDPDIGTDQECFVCEGTGKNIDTTPPQRTWVGLTDEEKQEWIDAMPYDPQPRHCMILVNVIEAKLKDKNL